jgi:hypothetical protein
MNNQLSPEERAQRFGTIIKVVALCVAAFFVAPIIGLVIEGLAGILAIGGIALTSIWALPYIEMKAKNIRLAMIKAEAAKHPIETLQAEYERRSVMLDERRKAIGTFEGNIRTYGDRIDAYKQKDPQGAAKMESDYQNLQTLLARQKAQWRDAAKGLDQFNDVIEKAKLMWDAAQSAALARAGSGLSQDAFYAKLKTETALDSVQNGLNSAFSDLDASMLEIDTSNVDKLNTAALPAPDARNVINVTPTKTYKKIAE